MYLKVFASIFCMLDIAYGGSFTYTQSLDWFYGFTAGPLYFGTPIQGTSASMFVYDTT